MRKRINVDAAMVHVDSGDSSGPVGEPARVHVASVVTREMIRGALCAASTLVFLVSTACSRDTVSPDAPIEEFAAHLDTRVPALMQRYDIPGASMALVRGAEIVWTGAYGYAKTETGMKMTADAVCRTESISKSVTAWGVMTLVEDGSIDLDAPVEEYLAGWEFPESDHDPREITVRGLLSGNAGLPLGTIGAPAEYEPGGRLPSLEQFLSREPGMTRPPGSGFVYSNVGFNTLELLVERVTGREFHEYMKNEVLLPLGMHDSAFGWRDEYASRVPNGYENTGEPVPPYVYPADASGGLLSTARDVARFVAAGMVGPYFEDRGVLTERGVRRIYTEQVQIGGMFGFVADAYGFGHFIEHSTDGPAVVWHGGQGHGWMTDFHSVPETGDGIVILTNSERSWPFFALVLADWSRWAGIGPVKFVRITYAQIGFVVLIGIALAAAAWIAYVLIREFVSGSRRFAPFARRRRALRIASAAVGLAGLGYLIWSFAQPYLFISSIFPASVGWGATALSVLSLVLVASALFPRIGRTGGTAGTPHRHP